MEKLDEFFQNENSPSGGSAILIAINDEILYEKTFGFAQIETNRRICSTTNFRLASLTKQFVGFAIFLLENEKKLKRIDSIGNYFSSTFNETYPQISRQITIEHLLEHRSGIYDFEQNSIDENFQWTDNDVIENLVDSTYFPPGEQFRYSKTTFNYEIIRFDRQTRSLITFIDETKNVSSIETVDKHVIFSSQSETRKT